MNYNYNQVKVKIIDTENWFASETTAEKINTVLKEIQDKGGTIEKIDSLMSPNNRDWMRTIITYREAVS